jgi:enoyl-CoA hydratase/carnithine racemase
MGLANMVVAAEQVVDVAREVAGRFNTLPPDGVRETKRLLKRAQARLVEETLLEEGRLFGARLGGPEVREAVAAFYERREPDFSRLRRDG